MKRYTYGPLGLIAVLLVANARPALAQDKVSGTKTAACLVRISSNEEVFPINADVIEQLLLSTPILGLPAREILGSQSLSYEEDVSVSFEELNQAGTHGGTVLIGKITVEIHDGGVLKARAAEFLTALCERLEAALQAAGRQNLEQLHQKLAQIEEELERVNQQYEEIRVLRQEFVEQTGRGELVRKQIQEMVRGLDERLHEAKLRYAGLEARETALSAQIAKIGERAVQQSDQDPIIAQLTRLVEIRENALERMKELNQAGAVSQEEAAEVEAQLLHARMDLMKYQQQMVEKAGAGLLENLNRELIQNGIELASSEVEYGLIEQRLNEIKEKRLLELADRYHREIELPLRFSEAVADELAKEQFELREELRNLEIPEVHVIGGNNRPGN